jgi:hypothetical protein
MCTTNGEESPEMICTFSGLLLSGKGGILLHNGRAKPAGIKQTEVITMTQKKLNEIKTTLNFLRNGRAATEQMGLEDCLSIYGISKAQALKNMDTAIAKYEREIEKAEHPLKGIDKKVYEIAAKHLTAAAERGDLETRHSDREDFIEIPVWGLEAALKEAYEAGRRSK